MLLTISTTHHPATDLGYLLVKHPDTVHQFALPYGVATVVFPEASVDRCTAALLLTVDTAKLGHGELNHYVTDRAFAASSLLSAALNRVFRSAARGASKDRPELAATPIPLQVRIPSARCAGGLELAAGLFEPLGWAVAGVPVALDPAFPEWGASRYVDLTLTGTLRLADALNHLYVLLPVLDDAKHYWVAPDEIDTLLAKGEGWLASHPRRGLITHRFLAHQKGLAARAESALESLLDSVDEDSSLDEDAPAEESGADESAARPAGGPGAVVRAPLAVQRRQEVLAVLATTGAARVLDLGCGAGALLTDLLADARYAEIVGADVSPRALELAQRRLRLDRRPERQRARLTLLQTALTYADDRLRGYDAAVLMEVIEHVDEPRLPALAQAVLGHAAPTHVIMTTPNAEYNDLYESLPAGRHRHGDHRFEWSRARFQEWCGAVASTFGYTVSFQGVGEVDPTRGTPTQLAHFVRSEAS